MAHKGTERQRRYVRGLIANASAAKPKPKCQLLREAGYGENVATETYSPDRSKGVQELLRKVESVGLSDEYLLEHLRRVVECKDQKAVLNAVRWVLTVKFPELNPFREAKLLNQTNVQVNMAQVEDGAYLYFMQRYDLTRDEIDKRLERANRSTNHAR